MIFKKKLNKFKYYNATPTPSKNYLNNFYTNIYFKKEITATYSKKYAKKELINKTERANFIIEFLSNKVKKKNFLILVRAKDFYYGLLIIRILKY